MSSSESQRIHIEAWQTSGTSQVAYCREHGLNTKTFGNWVRKHHADQVIRPLRLTLKQTYAREGKELRRKAGGYAHAKQFRRMRKTVKRQRTILGIVLREIKRKLATAELVCSASLQPLNTLLERAQRIHQQQPKDKNKRG